MPFPAGPYTNGQTHTENGTQYVYLVDRWDKVTTSANTLAGLTDVSVVTPADGDVLSYNSTISKWQNVPAPGDKALKLVSGGRGYGRTVLRGTDILRAGAGDNNRPFGIGLGNYNDITSLMPVFNSYQASTWKKFYEGMSHYVALSDEGEIYTAGDDSAGQQGTERIRTGDNPNMIMRRLEDPSIFGPGVTVLDIFSCDYNQFDTSAQGTMIAVTSSALGFENWMWGADSSVNIAGITGAPAGNKLAPYKIVDLPSLRAVKAHTGVANCAQMVVMDDGTVYSTGYNSNGALGIGTFVHPGKFTQAKMVNNVMVGNAVDVHYNLSVGSSTCSYVLLSNGEVLAAGSNNCKQLGDGTTTDRNTFNYVMVSATSRLQNITKIIGSHFEGAFFLDNVGRVWHVGRNHDGVRGDNQAVGAISPTGYATICHTDVVDAWCYPAVRGFSAAFFLKVGGLLYAAGTNTNGQLGIGTTATGTYGATLVPFPRGEHPVKIRPIGQVSETNLTYQGHIALTNANRVYVWGRNYGACAIRGLPETIPFPYELTDINNSVN